MSIVTIQFAAPVSLTDGTGITIETDTGKSFGYTSHAGDGTAIIAFTGDWTPSDIEEGDVVTFTYDGYVGNIVDGSGEPIRSIPATTIVNCLSAIPNGLIVDPDDGANIVDPTDGTTYIVDPGV